MEYEYELRGAIDRVLFELAKIDAPYPARQRAIEMTKEYLLKLRDELTEKIRREYGNEQIGDSGEKYYRLLCNFDGNKPFDNSIELYTKEDVTKFGAGKHDIFIYPTEEGVHPHLLKIPAILYVGDYRYFKCFENAEYMISFYPGYYLASRDGNIWEMKRTKECKLLGLI